jgi:hypothetical protein
MANDIFSIKNNLDIEFNIPTPGNWIWGVSQWDRGDVWGGSSSSIAWSNLVCEVVSVEVQRGVDIENGVLLSAPTWRASLTLRSDTYDPFTSGTIHVGTGVRVRFQPTPDTSPGVITNLFVGQVESFQVSYDAFGNNSIRIECVDALQAFLNTRVASYVVAAGTYPSTVMSYLFATYAPGVGLGNTTTNFAAMAAKTYTEVTVGEIVQDCLDVAQGALFSGTTSGFYYLYDAVSLAAILNLSSLWSFDSVHSAASTHICMTELVMAADSRSLPNEIQATLTTGTVMTLRNQDAYELYGQISLQKSINIDNTTDGQAWLDQLNLTTQVRRVNSLSFDQIQRSGVLRAIAGTQQLFKPVTVSYALGTGSFSDKYFITKVIDTITPYTWSSTLELWRGV